MSLETPTLPQLEAPPHGWRRIFHVWGLPLCVGIASALLLGGGERLLRHLAPGSLADGYRVQDWSSNWMMQTLGIEDILARGPSALWLNHVYPPLLDAIRLSLAWPQRGLDIAALQPFIDMKLYDLYAVLFGLVNVMLFVWVRSVTGSNWWALGATAVWAMMPGFLMTMTLLDPSPLAMSTITASLLFLFYFIRTRRLVYATGFFTALLLASLSRSVTQPHVLAIVVVAAVAFWVMARNRNWRTMLMNLMLVSLMFVMPIKQHSLFATFDTTSFGGYHRVGMLWIPPSTVLSDTTPQFAIENALQFSSRYNTQTNVRDNFRLNEAANTFIKQHPLQAAANLGKSLTVTLPELLQPPSSYTQNYLVERLPWRSMLDWLFSGWRYVALIILAVAVILRNRGLGSCVSLIRRYGWFLLFYGLIALPILFSNRYRPEDESLGPVWTDAARQKVFLEVPVIVLLTYALWLTTNSLRSRRGKSCSETSSQWEGDSK